MKPDTVLSMPRVYNNLSIISLLGTNIPIFVSDRKNPLHNIGACNTLLRQLSYPFASGIIAQTAFAKKVPS